MSDPRTLYYLGPLDDLDRQNIRAAKQRVYEGLVVLKAATPDNSQAQVVLFKGTDRELAEVEWPGTTFCLVEKFWGTERLDKALDRCLNGLNAEWERLALAVEWDLEGM